MAEKIMYGKELADDICRELLCRSEALERRGARARLSILRLGERMDDVAYEEAAIKRCGSVGIGVENIALPADTGEDELIAQIEELNRNERVSGIMLFRPLPGHIDERRACAAIAPEKDVDGVTARSMAAVYSGTGEGFTPCTAQACMELLKKYEIPVSGKRAVVIGRSLVCGKPAAMLLLRADATVTLCHSKTDGLPQLIREADIVIAALGRRHALDAECFRAGQTVLDVGMDWDGAQGRLCGDVDFDAVSDIVYAISPVPSGVGAVTSSILACHVMDAAERAADKNGL